MSRALGLAGVLLAAVAATLPVVSAADAASSASCRGARATILGTSASGVYGRSGRDVVVTNGASYVDAGGGDDLVCVTGATRKVLVVGGSGDDRVYVDSRTARVSFVAGTGSDTYVGNDRADRVSFWFGGTDRASTGRGGDLVSFLVSQVNGRTRLGLGTGSDTVSLTVRDKGSGPVPDAIAVDLARQLTRLSSGTERRRLGVHGAENVAVDGFRDATLRGDSDENELSVSGACSATVEGAAGDDTLRAPVNPNLCTTPGTSLADGGAGHDGCLATTTTGCEEEATPYRR